MHGHIVKISGPTVTARGLPNPGLHTVVRVGHERLLGEIMRIERDLATIQVYEDATGLALEEPVESTGESLVAELGPGLLGNVFDGLGRPLRALASSGGDFIVRGAAEPSLDRTRRWRFEPAVKRGQAFGPGEVLGLVRETPSFQHKILVPPGVSGTIHEVKEGELAVIDPIVVLEDRRELTMLQRWPVRRKRPYARRIAPQTPFLTGQRVLDAFFPVAAGGSAIIPGGFGTGKTVLEETIAKYGAADVIVYVGCGERGNEMAEVLETFPSLADPRTGEPLMHRTVLLVNTSNMPVTAREASIYEGITIAEYFRDMGYQVALMVDSTSRWAESLREISSRLEEMPAEEGYPTYLGSRLAQFYERAGRVALTQGGEGAVTIVGAVSPAGGDFSEPVTQASLRIAGAFWALDADLAARRHFPAVDWAKSYSLYADALERWFVESASTEFPKYRSEAISILEKEKELLELVQLVGLESIQDRERAVLESARLIREAFLQQDASDERDAYCPLAKTAWMLRLVVEFARRVIQAVSEGTPLKTVLEVAPLGKLTTLGQVAAIEMDRVGAELVTELESMPTRSRERAGRERREASSGTREASGEDKARPPRNQAEHEGAE